MEYHRIHDDDEVGEALLYGGNENNNINNNYGRAYRSRSTASPPFSGAYSSPQYADYYRATPEETFEEDAWMPPQPSSYSFFRLLMQFLEAVTHPNLGMVMTTLMIGWALSRLYHQQHQRLFQHVQDDNNHSHDQQQQQQNQPRVRQREWRVMLLNWLDQIRERDWLEWLQIQCVEMWDYAHFYSQMAMEMLRSLRLYWDTTYAPGAMISTDHQLHHHDMMLWEDSPEKHNSDTFMQQQRLQQPKNQRVLQRGAAAASPSRGAILQHQHKLTQLQQRFQHQQQLKQNARNAGGSVWLDLPELEEVVVRDTCDMFHSRLLPSCDYSRELEPAFLNEDDYPPGWLVYHPLLGVVTKSEAETFSIAQQPQQEEKCLFAEASKKTSNVSSSLTMSVGIVPSCIPQTKCSTPFKGKQDCNGCTNTAGEHTTTDESMKLTSIATATG